MKTPFIYLIHVLFIYSSTIPLFDVVYCPLITAHTGMLVVGSLVGNDINGGKEVAQLVPIHVTFKEAISSLTMTMYV